MAKSVSSVAWGMSQQVDADVDVDADADVDVEDVEGLHKLHD